MTWDGESGFGCMCACTVGGGLQPEIWVFGFGMRVREWGGEEGEDGLVGCCSNGGDGRGICFSFLTSLYSFFY